MATNRKLINEIALEKLENLWDISDSFSNFISNFAEEHDWTAFVYDEKTREIEGLKCNEGASRAVLIFDDFDYVIKIDFSDMADEKYDFCDNEVYNYISAVSYNVSQYFAETWYGGRFEGVPFYLMEKAAINEDEINDDIDSGSLANKSILSDESLEKSFPYMDCNTKSTITDLFINYYDEEEIHELLDFCYSYAINDIHNENVGYIDNKPVIIDYAGY